MTTRLSTGIAILDQRLGGGLPAGSIVALCAPPASQAELLLSAFAEPRETLYLTLDRPESAVADALQTTPAEAGEHTVAYAGDAERAIDALRDLPERSTLVVDPHSAIEETDRTRLREFLAELHSHLVDTGSLAVLHCLDGHGVSPLRDTTEHMADVVFRLTTNTAGAQVENRLAVPKFRGGRALTETLKLKLTDSVEIDTSRDIA